MDKRVSVVFKVTARPDKASEMRAVVLKPAQASREEDGCIRYDVLQNRPSLTHFCLSKNGRARRISTRTI